MEMSNNFGSLKNIMEIKPSPPINKQTTCVETRPIFRARTGSRNAMIAAMAFHTDQRMPTQFAPSLYKSDFGSVVP